MTRLHRARWPLGLGCAALLALATGACWDTNSTSEQSPVGPPQFSEDEDGEFQPIDDPIEDDIDNGDIQLVLEPIAEGNGLTAPVWGTHAPGQPGVLYVVDQDGPLWAIDIETGEKTVCLNTRDLLVDLGVFGEQSYDERGFLGVAFHPDYASNGLLYTYTSEPNGLPLGEQPDHISRIREWRVADPTTSPLAGENTDDDTSSGDCRTQDPEDTRVVFSFDQPQFNHNGGAIFFGAGGSTSPTTLYITSGDGGAADDQNDQTGFLGESAKFHGPQSDATFPNEFGNGQDENVVWGKVLSLDPTGSYGHVQATERSLPPGVMVYAYGFRNPYRGSVDRMTGEIWLGDVGQNKIEEVDGPLMRGGNYGWHRKEGEYLFHPDEYAIDFASDGFIYEHAPGFEDFIDPVAQYDHDEGVAIVGGFRYRGSAIAELQGKYVFGDYSDGFKSGNGRVLYIDPASAPDAEVFNLINGHGSFFTLGFGEDAHGELYVLVNEEGIPFEEEGIVFKIVKQCPEDKSCES